MFVYEKPLFAFQAHIDYAFNSKIWVALNGGLVNGARPRSMRLNGTTGNRTIHHSLKAMLNTGVATRAGQNYTVFTLIYQYIRF